MSSSPPNAPDHWRFWIDRGGTFTDVVARAPDGAISTRKLLSEDPGRADDAAVTAMKDILGSRFGSDTPCELRIGTTIATNALLERKGEPVLLAITRGFGDALAIGYQDRPDLFAREIRLPPPLYADVMEIAERIGADGAVVEPLDEEATRLALAHARRSGLSSIAIILMHGYRYPAHEQRLAALAGEAGFDQISVSHEIAPLIRLVGRGDTTVADAYLSPVIRRYVASLSAQTGERTGMLFMQSSGGLTGPENFRGANAILSGPAGGIVGMARTSLAAGFEKVIGFDMGGTSTDVAHFAGSFERDLETRVGGARLRTPMMRIHTVAAGGGSICRIADGRFQVGPESAGADPGPACYRRGGPLTVTDCNVMLGKLQPDHFPSLFGPDGDQPLDRSAVESRFRAMSGEAAPGMSAEQIAEGFIAIAVANMANAIRKISVQRGYDVANYTLACFGGAGGQHACLVAEALGMDRVLIHPLAGVLSAYGMGLADRTAIRKRTVDLALTQDSMPAINAVTTLIEAEATAALLQQGAPLESIHCACFAHLRHAGTDSSIAVGFGPLAEMRAEFDARYRAQFGFTGSGPLFIDMIEAEATWPSDEASSVTFPLPVESSPACAMPEVRMGGVRRPTPVFERHSLAAGFETEGPAIIIDPVSTTIVEPGWTVTVDTSANLILKRLQSTGQARLADPVRLEIFNGLFMGIAEEMGAALQRTAASVNIRERLDFSCAIFDVDGNLVANAPHMPVHLGSMGESVRAVMRKRKGNFHPGEAFALNAPYEGGTHLPDITVVMPVFAGMDHPSFYVAARGHHADIGGIAPGSMPPGSRSIEEEGILLDGIPIVSGGTFLEADLRERLGSGPWPSRGIDANIADLRAQVAACTKGAQALQSLAGEQGVETVVDFMARIQANAEQAVRRLISRLSDGSFRYEMDNGAAIAVRVTVDQDKREALFDFTGTSPQDSGNFNAPLPVTRAAILYVVRTLIDDPVPMNEGCMRPIRIHVPEGCVLNPRYPAAVVAGNVETSQVITDALFGALGAMAAAQGSMNNFTFGNEKYQYYETIAGGSGAGPGFNGASAVQTHMTNSRLTDPEVLETRFPVLLESFSIRRGSGGAGRFRGGDGATRRIRFLETMEAGILSNRRRVPPFGLCGGSAGQPGVNRVVRRDGKTERLDATAHLRVEPGDAIIIDTPGGGGFGEER